MVFKELLESEIPNYVELLSVEEISYLKELYDKVEKLNNVWSDTFSAAFNSKSGVDFSNDIDKAAVNVEIARNNMYNEINKFKLRYKDNNLDVSGRARLFLLFFVCIFVIYVL